MKTRRMIRDDVVEEVERIDVVEDDRFSSLGESSREEESSRVERGATFFDSERDDIDG